MSADDTRQDTPIKSAAQPPRQDGSRNTGLERAAQEPRAFGPPSGDPADEGGRFEPRHDPSAQQADAIRGPFGAPAAAIHRSFLTQARDEVSAWFGDTGAARRRLGDDPSHASKGPSVYVRSDERLQADVRALLNDDPIIDARNIEVTVKDRQATLQGQVQRAEDTRRAADLTDRVYGIVRVQNNLRFVAGEDQIPAATMKRPVE